MQISVRSYLTTATAAVVGAGAIGLVPAMPGASLQAAVMPATTAVQVALTGHHSPFGGHDFGSGGDDFQWGGFHQHGDQSGPSWGGWLDNGLLGDIAKEFAAQATPAFQTWATDLKTYVDTEYPGLITELKSDATELVQAFPTLVSAAVSVVKSGDLTSGLIALSTALTNVANPLQEISQAVLSAQGLLPYLSSQVRALAAQVPQLLRSSLQTVLGVNLQPAITQIVNALSSLVSGLTKATGAAAVAAPKALAAAASVAPAAHRADTVRSATVAPVADVAPAPAAAAKAPAPAAAAAKAPAASSSPAEAKAPAAASVDDGSGPAKSSRNAGPRAAAAGSAEAGSTDSGQAKPSRSHASRSGGRG